MKYSVFVFLSFLIFAPLSPASVTCDGIFLSEEQALQTIDTNTDQKVYAIVDLIQKMSEAPNSQSKAEILAHAKQATEELHYDIFAQLSARGLDFKVIESPLMALGDFGFTWQSYEILSTGTDHLNKVAKSLKKQIDAQLIYDPIGAELFNANGAFIEAKNAVLISSGALKEWPLNYVVGHEIIHAFFAGSRKNASRFSSETPVNIIFQSKESLNPKAHSQGYTKYMSFEELVTHAYNITMISKAVLKNRMIPGVIGNQDFLNNAVSVLIAVSENAKQSAEMGLAMLLSGKETSLEKKNGLNYISLRKEDSSFEISVFLPELKTKGPDIDARSYMKNELEKALKIANFNLQFFSEASSSSQVTIDAVKASNFRSSQQGFIKSLNH